MNAQVSPPRPAYGSAVPESKKGFPIGRVIFALVLVLAGAGFWYYFFGKKPRVVLTVPLPTSREERGFSRGGWELGNRELLLLADRELKLIDLKDRAVKWTSKVPAPPSVDEAQRSALNSRFVRLQEWANDLNRKRATLKTPEDTKAFTVEVAKYQAELAASRLAASKPASTAAPETAKETPPAAPAPAIPEKKAEVAGEQGPKLKPIITPEIQLLEARMKRRGEQITRLTQTIKTKKAAAKTQIQLSAVAEDEHRLVSLETEQKGEQTQLAYLQGQRKTPEPVKVATEVEPEIRPEWHSFFVHAARPFAGVVGSMVWLIDSEHMVSFDRTTGELKSDVPLAGLVLKAWEQNGEIYVVASAGPEARQITKITASGPVSLYAAAGKIGEYEQSGGSEEMMARIQKHRTEFCGPMLRADIKLMDRKVVARDAIKPGSDQELTEAVNNAPAHSSEELIAAVKLIQNDGKRLRGQTKFYVDESKYEVTLRRPFDTAIPDWNGMVSGRVQLYSTASCELLASGTKLIAFDHSNRSRWKVSLGAPAAPQDPDDSEARICLEVGDRLYFADGAFLTAFETATGKVLWRLPSIGIRKLQVDGDGMLYVHSLNLPTEALSGQFEDVSGEIHPLTIKVDPESGKVVWQEEKYEDVWVSGGDVYALRQGKRPEDIEEQVFSGKMQAARVKLYKLSPRTGQPIWDWFQPRRPSSVYADRKTVALLFDEELQVLHSIAY